MEKNKIFFYIIPVLVFLFISCSEKEKIPATASSPEASSSEVIESRVEEEPVVEPKSVVELEPVVEPEPEIEVAVDEETFKLQDFIDFPSWDLIGEGMKILNNTNSSESVDQLQIRLDRSANMMSRARSAFAAIQDLPEIKYLTAYPIKIIDLYIEAAEKFSSEEGDPATLEGLKEADSVLLELIVLLEKDGRNE